MGPARHQSVSQGPLSKAVPHGKWRLDMESDVYRRNRALENAIFSCQGLRCTGLSQREPNGRLMN